VVQRQEDVRGAVYVEAALQRLLGRQALDDHAPVRVELGLDPRPQGSDVVVQQGCASDDPEEAGDTVR
jgi:hypothetical protein